MEALSRSLSSTEGTLFFELMYLESSYLADFFINLGFASTDQIRDFCCDLPYPLGFYLGTLAIFSNIGSTSTSYTSISFGSPRL